MSIIDSVSRQAGRLAGDVQLSIRRARVEGERRLLQRQHRAALEELGERAYELVKAGRLPEEGLGPEVAAVDARLMELEAKAAEIDGLKPAEGDEPPPAPSGDPVDAAFPMVGGAGGTAPDAGPEGGPGPGWEAAGRFFKDGA